MKKIKQLLVVLAALSVSPVILMGQVDQLNDQIEKSVETLELDHDYADLFEDLDDLARKPVKINKATEEEINTIPFLSQNQRKALLDYMTTYGEIFSLYELQSIQGFDSLILKRIAPFIAISPPSRSPTPTPGNLIRFGHHDILLRYEQGFPKSMGFLTNDSLRANNPESYYKGSPQRYYFRYNYTWFDKIKIGIAGEKDPGEQFFRGPQSAGMDFYAACLSLSNIGILKNMTIGNFRVSYGQGLTMGSGLTLGSVPGFSTNITMANGIKPSLGMSEESYFRGLAATIKIKPFEISGFISYHPRDATVSPTDSASNFAEEISSFITTGYHRTGLEVAKKNVLKELVCGGNISFSKAPSQQLGFKIGITGIFVHFSSRVTPRVYPYNQYNFVGDKNFNFGLDYQVRFRRQYLFGEISRSMNSGIAFVAGAVITPDSRVSLTAIYRNYMPSYQNLFSNAFGQNGLNANEQGIYVAINAALHPKLNLSGYADLFTFPWLKYRVDSPTHGQEFGTLLTWQAAKNVTIGLRFYQKNTRINGTTEPDVIMHKLSSHITRSYRCNIVWIPEEKLVFKTRIEVKEASEPSANCAVGYFICQDITFNYKKWLSTVTVRFALFDAPEYETRIYTYEPEVLYAYSVPACQGKGMRTCVVMKFSAGRKVDIWVRGGLTYYTDRNEVGSGLDLTEGNVRGELTGQLMLRL